MEKAQRTDQGCRPQRCRHPGSVFCGRSCSRWHSPGGAGGAGGEGGEGAVALGGGGICMTKQPCELPAQTFTAGHPSHDYDVGIMADTGTGFWRLLVISYLTKPDGNEDLLD